MTENLVVQKTPRVRTKVINQSQKIDHYEYHTWYDSRAPTNTLVESGIVPGSQTIMHDVVTKPFRAVIARGDYVCEPMSSTESTYTAAPCSFSDVYYTGPNAAYSDTVAHTGHHWPSQRRDVFPTVPAPPELSSAREKAIARVFEKAYSPNFDTFINLKELPETVRMIGIAVRRLRSLWGLLTDPRRLVRAFSHREPIPVESLAGLWLEWRYGWRPFMMSVVDLIDAVNESMKDPPERVTYRATEKFTWMDSKSNESEYNPIGAPEGVKNTFSTSVDIDASYRAGIILSGQSITSRHRFGLDLVSLPAAIWDAIPYSFVVDWFIGVSTWLSGFAPGDRKQYASWCVERVKQRTVLSATFAGGTITSGAGVNAKAYTRTTGQSTLIHDLVLVNRITPISKPLLPTLDPKWAQFTNFKHLLDAISLLIQQLGQLASRR